LKTLLAILTALARRQRVQLQPGWQAPVEAAVAGIDPLDGAAPDALSRCCALLDWPAPRLLKGPPRPQDFPLVVWRAASGWGLADQWQSARLLRVITERGIEEWPSDGDDIDFHSLKIPGVRERRLPSEAFSIFAGAILSRRRILIEGFIATLVVSLLGLATSLFTMQVYDRVIPQGGLSTLTVLLVGVAMAVVMELALRLIRSISLDSEAADIDEDISSQLFARLQALRLDARPQSVGSLAAQMRGLEQVRAIMSSASLLVVVDLPFAFLLMWVVWMLGGIVALVPLVAFAVSIGLALLVSARIRESTKQMQTGAYKKNGQLVEALDAAETIKATQGGWRLLARWNEMSADQLVQERHLRKWSALASAGGGAVAQVTFICMVAIGALEVIRGNMTMGAVIACGIIANRITGPLISSLPMLIVQWGYARAALDGLDQILAVPVDREPDGDYLRPDSVGGALRVEGVRFAYPGTRAGLDIPALQIKAGERVAIIGPVGSGKSTLLKVLAGLFRPQSGTVLIGGLDLNQIAEDVLRREVAFLPQEYRLVQGSLRDNLLLGRADMGDEELLKVAASIGFDATIAAHPKGLQLPISEGGQGLSGGQRQLAGLTRVLLGSPRVMLLDEPTAALDPESEGRVMAAIDRAIGEEGTVVMVTHKLSLLSHVRRVILIAGGRVVLDGPTAVVLQRLQGIAAAPTAPAATGAPAGGMATGAAS
jgi:ATP-binding cassette subfamily C protein LapB